MRFRLGTNELRAATDAYWIAPNAVVIGKVLLEHEASIWWGAVLRGDNELITVGEGSNVQDNAVLHTDPGFPLVIEKHVTVGHLAMLHGCSIGAGSLIGIGSVVLNGARIGQNCLVGANALVTERTQIPDNSLVLGSPAKVIRPITSEQIEKIKAGTRRYVENWRRYQKDAVQID
ncbi:MAG: gamma carbonic anhydrase family protein [Pseudomonadota bacterium]